MKNFMLRCSGFMIAALIFVAQVSPMCFIGHYQSELPASLRK
jgi:cyclic lactone autoinducer peptide